jgi:hypothetical protein
MEEGVIASDCQWVQGSLGSNEVVLKIGCANGYKLHNYTKNHSTMYFIRVNVMVC